MRGWLSELTVHPDTRQDGVPMEFRLACSIWVDMGRKMDWESLPYLVEIYGIDDVEWTLNQLYVLRDHQWPTSPLASKSKA